MRSDFSNNLVQEMWQFNSSTYLLDRRWGRILPVSHPFKSYWFQNSKLRRNPEDTAKNTHYCRLQGKAIPSMKDWKKRSHDWTQVEPVQIGALIFWVLSPLSLYLLLAGQIRPKKVHRWIRKPNPLSYSYTARSLTLRVGKVWPAFCLLRGIQWSYCLREQNKKSKSIQF